jgi:hypothetical protein
MDMYALIQIISENMEVCLLTVYFVIMIVFIMRDFNFADLRDSVTTMISVVKKTFFEHIPTEQHADPYFDMTVALYNKGEYELALKRFEKLSKFDTGIKLHGAPHIERCRNVLDKKLSDSDKRHLENQAILKYFGWVDKVKYLTGVAAIVFWSLLSGDSESGTTFSDNLSRHPWFLVLAIGLAITTFVIHIFMRKFKASKNFVRCKYCGRYIPDKSSPGALLDSRCQECNRRDPWPDFDWDDWTGLALRNSWGGNESLNKEYRELRQKYLIPKAEAADSIGSQVANEIEEADIPFGDTDVAAEIEKEKNALRRMARRRRTEQIQQVLDFIEASFEEGTLEGIGPRKSAENRRNELVNMLELAKGYIAAGELENAYDQLALVVRICDWQVEPPDFVDGEAREELTEMITELMMQLEK